MTTVNRDGAESINGSFSSRPEESDSKVVVGSLPGHAVSSLTAAQLKASAAAHTSVVVSTTVKTQTKAIEVLSNKGNSPIGNFGKNILFVLLSPVIGIGILAYKIHEKVCEMSKKPSAEKQKKVAKDEKQEKAAEDLKNDHSHHIDQDYGMEGTGRDFTIPEAAFIPSASKKTVIPGKKYITQVARPEGDSLEAPGRAEGRSKEIGNGSTRLTGYGVSGTEGSPDVVAGRIVPTSKGGPNLKNLYKVEVAGDDGAPIIRCGVVDTADKANQLKQVLNGIDNPRGIDKPLRVVSNQLNSPEKEEDGGKKLISNQHLQMVRLNALGQKRGTMEVLHINTPFNRFYHFTRQFVTGNFDNTRLGKFLSVVAGSFLRAVATWIYFTGEKRSLEQNLEGWGAYAKWVSEDLQELNIPQTIAQGVGSVREFSTQDAIDAFRHAVEQKILRMNSTRYPPTEAERDKYIKELSQLRKELKKAVKNHYEALTTQISYVKARLEAEPKLSSEVRGSLESAKRKLELLQGLLGSQLGIRDKVVSRGQEQMMISQLNKELGVVEQINCKSGLDRTGIKAATTMAMRQMQASEEFSAEEIHELVMNWDQEANTLNKEAAGKKEGQVSPRPRTEIVPAVVRFRELVLQNLVKFGQPITQLSTGVAGLKWHKGYAQNLVALNFLPAFVKVRKVDENGKKIVKIVRLVEYDPKTGEPTKLTKKGEELFLGWSKHRES